MARRTLNVPFHADGSVNANNTTFVGTDLLAVLSSDAGIEVRPGMTIVRIRGTINIRSSVTGAHVSCIAALLVLGEGTTITNSLLVNIQNVIWRLDMSTSGKVVETAAGAFTPGDDVFMVESRGMRKISRVDDELRLMVTTGAGSGVIVSIDGTVRVMLE